MAKSKKKRKGPFKKFAENLTGRGGNPTRPGTIPRGATKATSTTGQPGYIDPKTGQFVLSPQKKKKR